MWIVIVQVFAAEEEKYVVVELGVGMRLGLNDYNEW